MTPVEKFSVSSFKYLVGLRRQRRASLHRKCLHKNPPHRVGSMSGIMKWDAVMVGLWQWSVAGKSQERWSGPVTVELCGREQVIMQVMFYQRHQVYRGRGSTDGDSSGQLMKEKSKSAKISCCSAVRTQGVCGSVSTGLSWVNSSSKLLTSRGALMTGRNGGFILLARRAFQSIPCQHKTPGLTHWLKKKHYTLSFQIFVKM